MGEGENAGQRFSDAQDALRLGREELSLSEQRVAALDEWGGRIVTAREAVRAWDVDWIQPAIDRARLRAQLIDELEQRRRTVDAAHAAATARLAKGREHAAELQAAVRKAEELLVNATQPNLGKLRALEEAEAITLLIPGHIEDANQRIAEAAEGQAASDAATRHGRQVLRAAGAAGVQALLTLNDECPVCGHDYDPDFAPDHGEVEGQVATAEDAVRVGQRRANAMNATAQVATNLVEGAQARLAAILEEWLIGVDEVAEHRARLQQQGEAFDAKQQTLNEDNQRLATRLHVLEEFELEVAATEREAKEVTEHVAQARHVDPGPILAAIASAPVAWPHGDVDAAEPSSVEACGIWFQGMRRAAEAERNVVEERGRAACGVPTAQDWQYLANQALEARDGHQYDVGALTERVATLADLVRRSEATAADFSTAAAELDVWDRLGRALRADELAAFVQRDTLAAVVGLAGDQLAMLSDGRYRLALTGPEEISVVDEWAGGDPRPAATLSGGETFLASLALALALAEETQAQATTGEVVQLLLIDEGFGTLDAEALDVVGGALARLRAGGRSVGVISHVDALRDHVGRVYEIRRSPTGSTIDEPT